MTRIEFVAGSVGGCMAGIALGYHLRHIDRALRAVEAAVEHHHAARAQAIAAASKGKS